MWIFSLTGIKTISGLMSGSTTKEPVPKLEKTFHFLGYVDLGIVNWACGPSCGYSQLVFCTISLLLLAVFHITWVADPPLHCLFTALALTLIRVSSPTITWPYVLPNQALPVMMTSQSWAHSTCPQCTFWPPCTEPGTLAWQTEWANCFQGR